MLYQHVVRTKLEMATYPHIQFQSPYGFNVNIADTNDGGRANG